MPRAPFKIGGVEVKPGQNHAIDLPISLLSNHAPMALPVQVFHGKKDGPTVFVSGALHGDEVNGVEIIRRLSRSPALRTLRGTLLAVPIVNVFGFVNHTRYLPDRRDLNRSFPGSASGSLASQLAHLFMTEVVQHCDYGIDLHTAAVHRENLPQIRADLDIPGISDIAHAFHAPVILHKAIIPGSLRRAADDTQAKVIVYEAGEALRFDEISIQAGLKGVLRVLYHLGMISKRWRPKAQINPVTASASAWTRAPIGGILRSACRLGAYVEAGDILGQVSDPFGEFEENVVAGHTGVIIGRLNLPMVNQGDAIVHIAKVDDSDQAEETIESFKDLIDEELKADDSDPYT